MKKAVGRIGRDRCRKTLAADRGCRPAYAGDRAVAA